MRLGELIAQISKRRGDVRRERLKQQGMCAWSSRETTHFEIVTANCSMLLLRQPPSRILMAPSTLPPLINNARRLA